MDQDLCREIEGKTIESVVGDENSVELRFSDGTSVEIVGRGHEEGSWLILRRG